MSGAAVLRQTTTGLNLDRHRGILGVSVESVKTGATVVMI